MSEVTIDQWTNIVTLVWMGVGFLALAETLRRRTHRWNGVGIAMTVLTYLAGTLYLAGAWNASVRAEEHIPGLPIWGRVIVRVLAGLALGWAIHKVRTVELVAKKNITPDDVPQEESAGAP